MVQFHDALATAIETYNEYRSPMATADLVGRDVSGFRVRFEGPFCRTCCRDDYFEDLVYELDELGVDIGPIAVERIEQTGATTFLVDFVVGSGDTEHERVTNG